MFCYTSEGRYESEDGRFVIRSTEDVGQPYELLDHERRRVALGTFGECIEAAQQLAAKPAR